MSRDEHPVCVIRAAPEESKAAALCWLLGPEAAGAGPAGSDCVLESFAGDRRTGALWTIVSPGRIATLIGPRLDNVLNDNVLNDSATDNSATDNRVTNNDASNETGAQLIAEANQFIDRQRVAVAQVLSDPLNESCAPLFRAAGYEHVVELDYLVSTRPASNSPNATPAGIDYERFQPTMRQRLLQVIGRTYESSQDCPGMNGVRQLDDVLDGYQHTGSSGDTNWYLIVENDEDIGCLLLADHPQDDRWEMIYLGVTPEQRGRSIGLAAAKYAQDLALQAGRARVTLAVDATNLPAQSVYQKAGFIRWDRKRVLLRFC